MKIKSISLLNSNGKPAYAIELEDQIVYFQRTCLETGLSKPFSTEEEIIIDLCKYILDSEGCKNLKRISCEK